MPFDNPKPVVDHPVVALLKAATERIKQYWVQQKEITSRKNSRGHYGFCMMGSIIYDDIGCRVGGLQQRELENMASAYMNKAVAVLTRDDVSVVSYNDNPSRLKEDVVLAMEIATELAEQDETININVK